MANKYKLDNEAATIGDLMDEEDRECLNDLMRAQTSYYNSLTEINNQIIRVLSTISDSELKEAIVSNRLRIPIKSITE